MNYREVLERLEREGAAAKEEHKARMERINQSLRRLDAIDRHLSKLTREYLERAGD